MMGAGNRKYRRMGSTEEIEAVRHMPGNSVSASMGAVTVVIPEKFTSYGSPLRRTTVFTAEGEWLEVQPGEWIVRDKNGIHVCSHDAFAANHIPAN